jgi:hypothetical protein
MILHFAIIESRGKGKKIAEAVRMASWKQINFSQIARDFWKYQQNKLGAKRVNNNMEFRMGWDYSQEELTAFFAQYKLQYINHGRSRATCIVDGKWVVKFPIGLFGLECNEKEVKAFKAFPQERRQYFTRLLQRGLKYEYLLCERVTPNDDNFAKIPREVRIQVVDTAYFNYGQRMNGEWVVLDYAEEI